MIEGLIGLTLLLTGALGYAAIRVLSARKVLAAEQLRVTELAASVEALKQKNLALSKYEPVVDAEAHAARLIQDAAAQATKAVAEAEQRAAALVLGAEQQAAAIIQAAKIEANALVAAGRSTREAADQALAAATKTAGNLTISAQERARTAILEAQENARTTILASQEKAKAMVSEAQEHAKQIAGEAYELKENVDELERTARALKNVIEGYGDDYIVPGHSVLDDLADPTASVVGWRLRPAAITAC